MCESIDDADPREIEGKGRREDRRGWGGETDRLDGIVACERSGQKPLDCILSERQRR
jgi:hypothetical protein